MIIPNTLHLFWAGDDIFEREFQNIKKAKALNPEYQVILWTDQDPPHPAMSKYAQCAEFGIEVKSIGDYQSDFGNFDLIESELNKVPPDYTAASDIVRVDLMVSYGGIYQDAGIEPQKSFKQSNINFDQDFLCTMQYDNDRDAFKYIGTPEIFASIPQHPLFLRAQEVLRETVDIASTTKEYLGETESGVNTNRRYLVTKVRTGASISIALELLENPYGKAIQSGKNTIAARHGRLKAEARSPR